MKETDAKTIIVNMVKALDRFPAYGFEVHVHATGGTNWT